MCIFRPVHIEHTHTHTHAIRFSFTQFHQIMAHWPACLTLDTHFEHLMFCHIFSSLFICYFMIFHRSSFFFPSFFVSCRLSGYSRSTISKFLIADYKIDIICTFCIFISHNHLTKPNMKAKLKKKHMIFWGELFRTVGKHSKSSKQWVQKVNEIPKFGF